MEAIVKKYLKYDFSEEEKRQIANGMALAVSEVERLEGQKKEVMSDFNSKIEGAKNASRSAANKLQNGYEYRDIECSVYRDYERKKIILIRTDTMEEVEVRKMTSEELQMKFDDVVEA